MRKKTFSRSHLSIAIRTAIVGSGTALALAVTPALQANEVDDVRLEVQQLMNRIDQLESKKPGRAIPNPDAKQATIVQEADAEEKVYTAYKPKTPTKKIRNANHQDDTVDPLTFKLGASRTNGTELGSFIEGDFYGGGNQSFSNSTSFRLRHAYITYGNWGFGQTWSNFMENNLKRH